MIWQTCLLEYSTTKEYPVIVLAFVILNLIDENSLYIHLFYIPNESEVLWTSLTLPFKTSESICCSNEYLPTFYVHKTVLIAQLISESRPDYTHLKRLDQSVAFVDDYPHAKNQVNISIRECIISILISIT